MGITWQSSICLHLPYSKGKSLLVRPESPYVGLILRDPCIPIHYRLWTGIFRRDRGRASRRAAQNHSSTCGPRPDYPSTHGWAAPTRTCCTTWKPKYDIIKIISSQTICTWTGECIAIKTKLFTAVYCKYTNIFSMSVHIERVMRYL